MRIRRTNTFSIMGMTVRMDGLAESGGFVPHGDVDMRFPGGARALQGEYRHGAPTGRWRRWHPDGALAAEQHYAGGRLHGDSRQWYDDGTPAREVRMHRGLPEGELKIWGRDLTLLRRIEFRGGRPVRSEYFRAGRRHDIDHLVGEIRTGGDLIAVVPEKYCRITNGGKVRCKTLDQIRRDLLTMYPPEVVTEVMERMNEIYDEVGLDRGNKVLTECSGTFVAVEVNETGSLHQEAGEHDARMSKAEVEAMMNACSAAARPEIEVPSGMDYDAAWREWVEDAVATMDEQIANCDDGNRQSMIADGVEGGGFWADLWDDLVSGVSSIASGVSDAFDAFVTAVSGFLGIGNDQTNQGEQTAQPEAESPVLDDGWKEMGENEAGNKIFERRQNGVVHREIRDADGNIVKQEFIHLSRTSYIFDTGAEIYFDKVEFVFEGDIEVWYFHDGDELVYQHFPGGERPDGDFRGNSGPGYKSRSPGDPGPGGVTDTRSCAALARWWAFQKDQCDRAGWDSYQCQQLLRMHTHCVDSALILPTPDGSEFICPRPKETLEETRRRECERRRMIESRRGIMLPSGFGTDLCQSTGIAEPSVVIDPCTDPRAILPHECPLDGLVPVPQAAADGTLAPPAPSERFVRAFGLANPRGGAALQFARVPTVDADELEALSAKGEPVLAVFTADGCGPCNKVLDTLDEAAADYEGRMRFVRVDVRDHPALADRHGVRHTPTMMVFRRGELVGQRRVGAATRELLLRFVDRGLRQPAAEKPAG